MKPTSSGLVSVVLLVTAGCSQSSSSGSRNDAGSSVLLDDQNNYHATASLSLPTMETASGVDLDICWTNIASDMQCHPVAPQTDIDNVAQDGAKCATAFGALDSCLSAAPCAGECMGNSGNGGATASGGTMVVGGTISIGGMTPNGGTGGVPSSGGVIASGGITAPGGTTGAPPTLSQDQSTFESFTMSPNAAYQCYYSLPYQGIPVSGTNYFMASSAQLTTSPSTGAWKGAQKGLGDIGKLPIPTDYAPFRYLVGGKIVVSSEPVWIASVSYPAGSVEGISGGVRYDLFDTTGTIIVWSHIRSGYSIVQLTGKVASNSFPDLVNYLSPLFYNATPLLAPDATWAAGAAYEKFTATQIGDTYMVFDFSQTQTASGTTPKPVATATTIAALMNAGGILVSSDGTTYTLALGSVSMISGVNTYVATSPRLSPKTTPGYATFYELNGNVYFGEVIRDGTVLGGNPYAAPGAYPTLTYTEDYAIRLNEAAVTSLQNSVTF